jgi:hypothetical protein
MSPICNLMLIFHCPLVRIVIVDEVSNHFYVNTLRTVHIEYDSMLSKILHYSNTYTNSDVNMMP